MWKSISWHDMACNCTDQSLELLHACHYHAHCHPLLTSSLFPTIYYCGIGVSLSPIFNGPILNFKIRFLNISIIVYVLSLLERARSLDLQVKVSLEGIIKLVCLLLRIVNCPALKR